MARHLVYGGRSRPMAHRSVKLVGLPRLRRRSGRRLLGRRRLDRPGHPADQRLRDLTHRLRAGSDRRAADADVGEAPGAHLRRACRCCAGRRPPGAFISSLMRSRSSARNWSHSVRITSASAPSRRLVGAVLEVDVRAAAGAPRAPSGSKACTLAPMACRAGMMSSDGRVAHVVGVGLEGQAEHADRSCRPDRRPAPSRPCAAMAFLRASLTSTVVSTSCSGAPASRGGAHQGQGVLGKAGAAVAGAGVQELGADALVQADAAGHLLHVGADRLAQVGHLVDEGDLHAPGRRWPRT